jgi:gliding motility-associated-like protein
MIPIQLFSQENAEPISPCVSELNVPNSFSANGDNVNDIFLPKLIGEPHSYEFTVYNRWGEVIFSTDKVTEGWNGSLKGMAQPMDVYVWKLRFTCEGSKEDYSYSGDVTLVR